MSAGRGGARSSRLPAAAVALLALAASGCVHSGRSAGREILWQGPVEIREDLLVAPGETLLIRPGARVTFAFRDDDGDGAGDARVVVRGAVRAIGTEESPIVFGPGPGAPAVGWKEMFVEDAARAQFAWCRFSGAQQALHVHRTALVVEHSRIERNRIGVRFTGGPVVLRKNQFEANDTAIRYWESGPEISGNRFQGNETAIFVREGSIGSVVRGNDFLASADYHVKLGESQAADVDARGNWWGTVRRDEIERLVFDFKDADYLGQVRYDPPAPSPRVTVVP